MLEEKKRWIGGNLLVAMPEVQQIEEIDMWCVGSRRTLINELLLVLWASGWLSSNSCRGKAGSGCREREGEREIWFLS